MKALLVALAACHPAASSQPAAPQAAAVTGPAPAREPGIWTSVVALAPGAPTPVVDGPFLVIAINPGTSLDLAVAPAGGCGGAQLAWFAYSGGGVAAGKGQTLCARSHASEPVTHGFSGHD